MNTIFQLDQAALTELQVIAQTDSDNQISDDNSSRNVDCLFSCSGSCGNGCSNSCSGTCSGGCDNGCDNGCSHGCESN